MRVLLAAQSYQQLDRTPVNGPGVFTRRLAEGLAAAGDSVLVLVPSDRTRGGAVVCAGVAIRSLPALPVAPGRGVRVTVFPAARVAQLTDRFRPDVVHLQDHYPLSRAVLRVALRRGIPVVATNHYVPASMLLQLPSLGPARPVADRILWALLLDVLRRVQLATAPTRTAARLLVDHGLETPVEAVSCGVDVARFDPPPREDRAATRRKFGLDPAAAVALYVGRLDRDKSVEVVVRAAPVLRKAGILLALVGTGADAPRLRALAGRLGVADSVVFTGRVADDDLPPLLRAADVFVMPGEIELQSIATLEAMSASRPVVAARAGALPELVEPGATGLLFRPGDPEDAARCIVRLAAAPELGAEMGRRARALAEEHSLSRTVARFEAIYASLAEAARRPWSGASNGDVP